MTRAVKWLVLPLILASVLLLAVAGISIVFLLEDKPWVTEDVAGQLDQADSVNPLLKQARGLLRYNQYPQTLRVSKPQLQSLAGLAQRALPGLQGQVGLSEQLGWTVWSYRLPDNPFGRYINLRAELLPAKGMQLGDFQVGGLRLRGDTFLHLATWILDWKLGDELASDFLQRIEQVQLSEQQVVVRIAAFDDLYAKLKALPKSALSAQDELKRQRVQFYLSQLDSMALPPADISLGPLIGHVFEHARQRAQAGANAYEENEAALMALAIFAGTYRFAHFVGDLNNAQGKIPVARTHTTLAGRRDLSLHFLYSAAIKLLSEQGVSMAIGEFKELMDRSKKDSGFSFVDLTADMTGIRFAELATHPDTAVRLQEAVAGLGNEALFFPDVSGLPEGFDKQAFTERYQQVDSQAYKAEIQEIHRRIDSLALYQP
ncbi:hypothetical protein [Bowmanella denitrificans]|uniref:hypothetical protein n=1 Tax=Bowmanella denitrificans TaxID=366582 RepID=UPI000C9C2A90|nr:hypothetical protein [Bowmanella denitrificans]